MDSVLRPYVEALHKFAPWTGNSFIFSWGRGNDRKTDARKNSIRYPDPSIRVNDTVKIDLATGKIADFIHFDTGVIAMATGGRNMGRVGVITHRERHDGGFNIVHIKDAIDNEFATRESNVFVIGREKPWVSLPKGKGVKVCLFSPKHFYCWDGQVLMLGCSFRLPRREIAGERFRLLGIKLLVERYSWKYECTQISAA